jgi:hypothetical protein
MSKSNHYKNGKGEPYDFQVLVYTRPNLRGSEGEMFMYMGKSQLEIMFDECRVDPTVTNIHFEYPERWANILELRAMVDRIPISFPNIEKVTIVTHSVYIIQCTHSEHIGICDNPSKYPEEKYKDLNIRYSPAPKQLTGLYCATPEKIEKIFESEK